MMRTVILFPVIAAACLLAPLAASAQSLEELLKSQPGLDLAPQAEEGDPKIEVSLNPVEDAADEVLLAVRITLPDGAYTYSLNESFSGHTGITIEQTTGVTPLDDAFASDRAPKVAFDEVMEETLEKFFGEVTLLRRFRVAPGADRSRIQVTGLLRYQVCKNTCRTFKHPFEVALSNEPVAPPTIVEPAPADAQAAPLTFGYRVVPLQKGAGKEQPGPAAISFRLSPSQARAGEEVTLSITMDLEPGWKTYALQPAPDQIEMPTEINLSDLDNLERLGEFTATSPPEEHASELGTSLAHVGRVTWTAKLRVLADGYGVAGRIDYQICDANTCRPGNSEFSLGSSQRAADLANATAAGELMDPAAPAFDPTKFRTSDHESANAGLLTSLLAAFLGGLLLNVMPCVLPVLAIKLLSFVQQAGESRGRILALNLTYSAGVVLVFAVLASLAVFLGYGWGQQFQNAEFRLVMACVVFAMALSLLGVFEIPIPGLVGSAAGEHQKEGLAGAFMTGVFATLLATPCTGPFMGSTLAWSVKQPSHVVYLVWTVMGLGMASPYLVIGVFPRLVELLPRPGMWMVRFKEFSGFVLLATVVFLMRAFDKELLIPALVMMLGIAMGLWMIGNLYHATSSPRRRWTVRGLALLAAAPILYFGYSLYVDGVEMADARRMARDQGETIIAPSETSLPWQTFSSEKLESVIREGKPVLVDFTADWCLICKQNEEFALNTADTIEFVKANGVATLYADFTNEDPEIGRWLDIFRQNGVPLTVIFPAGRPNEPMVLRGLYSQGTLLKMLSDAVPQKSRQTAAAGETSTR